MSLKRYTPLRAKKPWRRSGKITSRVGLARSTPMKKRGKRTKAWDSARKDLKVAFQRAGITTCELRVDGICWVNDGLGFCHTKKRRNIPPGSPLLLEVVLGCNHCHDIIERWGEKKMGEFILEIINQRKVPVILA